METGVVDEVYELEVAASESPNMSLVPPLLENERVNGQPGSMAMSCWVPSAANVPGEGLQPLTVTVGVAAELAIVTVMGWVIRV